MATRDKTLCCSFCGKGQTEVKKLVAGPMAFICNDCIDVCLDIICNEAAVKSQSLDDFLPIMTGKSTPLTTPKHRHH